METKLFEVRDAGTCIVALAIRTKTDDTDAKKLLNRGGWSNGSIILCDITGDSNCTHDPYIWLEKRNSRTMYQAHIHIIANFDKLPANSVIDVEYILGERNEPKKSEILNRPLYY